MSSHNAYNLILKTGISNLELEVTISKDDYFSLCYARSVLKGRFELGEELISKYSFYSWCYAVEVLNSRFELGEELISKDCHYSWDYAKNVLKGRFKLGELIIMQDKNHLYSLDYFINVLGYDHE